VKLAIVPPMTKPKNRPEGIAVRPGSHASAQQVDDSGWVEPILGQDTPAAVDQLIDRSPGGHRPVAEAGQPGQGVRVRVRAIECCLMRRA